ncbi:MAG: reverse transcriptase domain-containing protein, partial [Bacteroidota bacterium]
RTRGRLRAAKRTHPDEPEFIPQSEGMMLSTKRVVLDSDSDPEEPIKDVEEVSNSFSPIRLTDGDPLTEWQFALIDSGAAQSISHHMGPYIHQRYLGPLEITGINNSTVVDTLVTAEFVVQTEIREDILVICGDMIYHPTAWTTLQSFSQIEASGHFIYTRPRPRIVLQSGETIPLYAKNGLYKLRYRFPTYAERNQLRTFVLTLENFDHHRHRQRTIVPQVPLSRKREPKPPMNNRTIRIWRLKLMNPSRERLDHTLRFSITREPTYVHSGEDPDLPIRIKAKPHKGHLTIPESDKEESDHVSTFLEIVDTDTFFSTATSHRKERCAQIFVDRGTRTVFVVPMRTKGAAGFALEKFIQVYGIPASIHSDNAPELTDGRFGEICLRNGIHRSYSTPHTPQQNGIAERHIGTIKMMANQALQISGLPTRFWSDACTQATTVFNLTANRGLNWMTPASVRTGIRSSIAFLHPFGCLVSVKMEDPPSFGARTWMGLYLGNDPEYPRDTAKIFNPATGNIVHRRDVIYHDTTFPCKTHGDQWLNPNWHQNRSSSGGVKPRPSTPIHRFRPISSPANDSDQKGNRDTSTTIPSLRKSEEIWAEDDDLLHTDDENGEKLGGIEEIQRQDFIPRTDQSHTNVEVDIWSDESDTDEGPEPFLEADLPENEESKGHRLPIPKSGADWIGTNVYRTFKAPGTNARYEYEGYVQSSHILEDGTPVLRVRYSDGDEEDIEEASITQYLRPKSSPVKKHTHEVDEANILSGRRRSAHSKPTNGGNATSEVAAAGGTRRPKFKEGFLIPKSHGQAMNTPQAQEWRAAEEKELNAMRDLQVFEEVDYLPDGAKAIPFMVLYDVKADLRFKVRMVARGDLQDPSTYFDSYSPVVRISTLRLIMAIALTYELVILTTDINTAYLNAPIDTDIYFKAPDFFPNPGAILRAKKAIYGLKQAGVCWFLELEEKLSHMGFERTIVDR